MSKKRFSEKALAAILSAVTLGAGGLIMAGCSQDESGPVGYIDAPETLQAELGTYVVPEYDVVDKNGMILYGYNVKLKSATDASGNALEITGSAVTVDVAGIYDFVYTANSDGVDDVTVKIDFADRTAPTINIDDSTLPDFFISGNSYRIPAYTVSGDFVREKCWSKVFHIADDDAKTETEVEVTANRFNADQASGAYEIRIHVEDAVGNVNDYKYTRNVDGPEHFVENKVLYLDEAFGARQVSVYQPDLYTGEFVPKDAEGAKVREGENGAYKVSFDGVTETNYNEGLVVMNVPAVVDITDCVELEMYVYNDSEADIIMGSQWWNDTPVKKKEWTKLTWKVDSDGWANNKSADNRKVIGTVDITGMTIRFIFDYGQKVIPNGDFYLSSMRAIPKEKSQVTAGENVTLGNPDGAYFVGDTVMLTAAEVPGKTFDCFLVDGKPIIGDNFVARNATYSVTAKYIDGALTKDNMTWGTVEEYMLVGSDDQHYKIGESNNWVLSYDVYGMEGTGWNYFAAYIGGKSQLLGIELAGTTVHKATYYGEKYPPNDNPTEKDVKTLSDEITALLRGATEQNPVTAIYIRQGDIIKQLLKSGDNTYFVAAWDYNMFELSGDGFGIGGRNGPTATLKNINGVSGATRVALFTESLRVNITKTSVTTDKAEYSLGDTVVLTAAAAPDDKAFAYFEVNGERIEGNSFTVTELKEYTAEAIYLAPEKTYKVTVDEFDGHAKITDGKYTLPTANVTDNDGNVKDYAVTAEVVDAAGNSYTVTNGKIDISYAGSVRLAITYTAATLDSEYKTKTVYVTVQSGDTLFVPTEKSLGFVKNADSNASTFEYDTAKKHGEDQGSVKVTPDKADTGFTIEDFDFTDYDFVEFYVYTEGENVKAGAYWLGDTTLTQNDWTKIVIDLKGNVYLKDMAGKDFVPNGVHKGQPFTGKFILRVMNNAEKHPVWISSVTAGYWPAATITCADSNVTLDKASYKLNDTVTLTAADAESGKIFSHFTVDGVKIEGNTFKVTKTSYTVAAVYTDISDISFAADSGISTADGETRYARGAKVTLIFDESKAPSGNVFDCFKVDGVKINGNTFVTSKASHEITAEFIQAAAEMTWTTASGDNAAEINAGEHISAVKFGNAESWIVKYTITNLPAGGWGQLTGVYIGAQSQIASLQFSGAQYTFNLYGGPIWSGCSVTISDANAEIVKNASTENPVTLTFVRNAQYLSAYATTKDGSMYLLGKLDISAYMNNAKATNDFGYAYRTVNFAAPVLRGDITFVTGAGKVGLYNESLASTITHIKEETTDDKVSFENKKYYIGDTVTLNHAAPDTGFAFSHYTVDGVKIEGNTFTVTKTSHNVTAEYVDVSETYHIVATAPTGTVLLENGKLTLPTATVQDGNGETIDGYTVTAVVTDSKGNSYTVTDGVADITYNGAIDLTVTYSATGLEGNDTSINISVRGKDGTVVQANALGASLIDPNGNTVSYSEEQKHETEQGSIKITTAEADSAVFLCEADTKRLVEFYCYTSDAGVSVGTWWCGNTKLTQNAWTRVVIDTKAIGYDVHGGAMVLRIMGSASGSTVYVSSVRTSDLQAAQSDTQLNNVLYAKAVDQIKSLEYVTDKQYDGADEKVKENGAIKVTTSGNESAIATNAVYIGDMSQYSEVYFYVYTDVTGAKAGAWWCGDKALTAGAWTKVTLSNTLAPQNAGDGSNIFSAGLKDMVFRIMNGGDGGVFYVTSLYGTPKA